MPTETQLQALGSVDDASTSIRDASLLAAVTGRGHSSDRSSDDAVERRAEFAAMHRDGRSFSSYDLVAT